MPASPWNGSTIKRRISAGRNGAVRAHPVAERDCLRTGEQGPKPSLQNGSPIARARRRSAREKLPRIQSGRFFGVGTGKFDGGFHPSLPELQKKASLHLSACLPAQARGKFAGELRNMALQHGRTRASSSSLRRQ